MSLSARGRGGQRLPTLVEAQLRKAHPYFYLAFFLPVSAAGIIGAVLRVATIRHTLQKSQRAPASVISGGGARGERTVDGSQAGNTHLEMERVGLLFEDLCRRLAQINRAAKRAQFDSEVHGGGEILGLLESLSRALEQLRTRVQAHEQQREQLRTLRAIGAVINSSLELSEVLQQVMDAIIELTGAERGFLMLIEEDSGRMQVHVGRNMDRETISRSSFEISRSVAQRVAQTGEAVVTLNAQTDPRFNTQESIISYALTSASSSCFERSHFPGNSQFPGKFLVGKVLNYSTTVIGPRI